MSNFEWITVILSIIGSTWYLSACINDCVKHSVCSKRRKGCQCVKDIKRIEQSVNQLRNEWSDEDESDEENED